MAEDSYSLSAKVFKTLRGQILSGQYQANEELKEKTIGDDLGVSRTPVREALRQLELEGLVSIIPNKGAFVIGVSLEDIKDIYEIRSLLEGLCAKWAAERITEDQLAEFEENILLSEFHGQKGNWEQLLELDNKFHQMLYEASGSKELIHVLKDYHQYVQRIRRITLTDPARVKASTAEHRQIVEALKSHDPLQAQEAATNHINSTRSNMDKIGWENLMKKEIQNGKN